jgi:N-hydroxyarylamine O-acetyltransferase
MDDRRLDAYLDRIGVGRPARADAASLAELQVHHLRSVPFENLSIHLGEPIVLEPAALVDKLVDHRRGGYCYELNGAFAALLSALGFSVTLLAARVATPVGLGPPFDHLALRVDADDGRITLKDRTLVETTPTGRLETTLPGDAEVLDTYRTSFGIALDHRPSPRSR